METVITVSPELKLQVNGTVSGSPELHLEAPSLTFPVPPEIKIRILSFWQAWIREEASAPLTVALLNFQEACVSNWVFVLGGVVLFLSQDERRSMLKARLANIQVEFFFMV